MVVVDLHDPSIPIGDKLEAIRDRGDRDPVFRAALAALITEEDLEDDERVCRDILRDPRAEEFHGDAARCLLRLQRRKQKVQNQ